MEYASACRRRGQSTCSNSALKPGRESFSPAPVPGPAPLTSGAGGGRGSPAPLPHCIERPPGMQTPGFTFRPLASPRRWYGLVLAAALLLAGCEHEQPRVYQSFRASIYISGLPDQVLVINALDLSMQARLRVGSRPSPSPSTRPATNSTPSTRIPTPSRSSIPSITSWPAPSVCSAAPPPSP